MALHATPRETPCNSGLVGWVPTHWVRSEEGRFIKKIHKKTCERLAACLARPSSLGKLIFLNESGTLVQLLTGAAAAPWGPTHASASMLQTKSFLRQRSLEGAHHH